MQSVDIIKRGRAYKSEPFLREKLHRSIVATCMSLHTPEGQSEIIAHSVCDSVIDWLEHHPEVTSNDLRIATTKHLRVHHPEAAYIYEQHRITI